MHENISNNNLTFNKIRSFTQDKVEFSLFIHSGEKKKNHSDGISRVRKKFDEVCIF